MGPWRIRRRRAAYSRLVAQISEHEVVAAAEEIVGGAWMEGLRDAENQAETAKRVCTDIRDTAYEAYCSAKSGQDPDRLSESYQELAATQQALGRVRDRHDSLRRFADRERIAWAEAAKTRAQEILTDQELLSAAAYERESRTRNAR
ncbi:hypothetical protein GCM10009839_08710 [Catenulispora yoronensis]|uniref:Flagellar FliJ protein n=1 Tax=Catenulispora yoronensis TaxID=450799 RepID=A0ABP5F5U1_9ACTN